MGGCPPVGGPPGAAERAIGVPHTLQNLSVGLATVPHCGHALIGSPLLVLLRTGPVGRARRAPGSITKSQAKVRIEDPPKAGRRPEGHTRRGSAKGGPTARRAHPTRIRPTAPTAHETATPSG